MNIVMGCTCSRRFALDRCAIHGNCSIGKFNLGRNRSKDILYIRCSNLLLINSNNNSRRLCRGWKFNQEIHVSYPLDNTNSGDVRNDWDGEKYYLSYVRTILGTRRSFIFPCLRNNSLFTADDPTAACIRCNRDIVTLSLLYTSSFAILQFANCPVGRSFEMSLFRNSSMQNRANKRGSCSLRGVCDNSIRLRCDFAGVFWYAESVWQGKRKEVQTLGHSACFAGIVRGCSFCFVLEFLTGNGSVLFSRITRTLGTHKFLLNAE